jgi:uncharacterized protein (DUF169 family)
MVHTMAEWSDRLKTALTMDLEPVGVRIFGAGDDLISAMDDISISEPVKSYCEGLTLAARGRTTYGGSDELGCSLGTITLGLEKNADALLKDLITEKYAAGIFETEEASRQSVGGANRFAPEANQAVLIGPLSQMTVEPQLVILEVDPEQAMWALYAANYKSGGTQQLPQSGGVAGGCADVTLLPIRDGAVNITFMGLSCRIKSGIPPSHLLVGLPADKLEEIIVHLEKMSKPMAKLKQSRV